MSRTCRLVIGVGLGLLMAVATATAGAQAEAKKVKYEELPQAVQITVDERTSGMNVSGYTMEEVDGQTLYRVNLLVLRRPRVITIAADGKLVSVDDRIPWQSIPANVQAAMLEGARPGTLGEFHSISRDGKILSYTAMVDSDGERRRIAVNVDGATLEGLPSASASPATNEN